ncbi:hypothetical protein E6H20_10650 [Candidatus Bathyarchaeota archaeon]|nr:MAG: hypothetical protein E6H20_10650 [Candidatus Bathyarchaeota archaeon]
MYTRKKNNRAATRIERVAIFGARKTLNKSTYIVGFQRYITPQQTTAPRIIRNSVGATIKGAIQSGCLTGTARLRLSA